MHVKIPFISRIGAEEEEAWIEALNKELSSCTVVSYSKSRSEEFSLSEVALVANPNPQDLRALPKLRWVQSLWSGVEALIETARSQDFALVRMKDPQLAQTMSEAALTWTLYLHRSIPKYRQQQNKKLWIKRKLKQPSECTVGVLGMGALGHAAAERLRANGFKVVGWSRTERESNGIRCVCGDSGLLEVFSMANIVVILLPLTQHTLRIINKPLLTKANPGISIINLARGQVIDEEALLAALDDGLVDHAVLDVFDNEPLEQSHPYWKHPGVTVLPHVSAPTNKSTAAKIAALNIDRYFSEGAVPTEVDSQLGY